MPASASSLAAAVAVEITTPALPAETIPLVLEVTRGRTRFRSRPVSAPRFLIGAGVTCDLRLGGDEVPVLHSIITLAEGALHLEAIAPAPLLIVNGQAVREAELFDGDVIGIGDVELRARIVARRAPAGVQLEDATVAAADGGDSDDDPLSDLTAAELIERIEADERRVEEFEERRLTGAKALAQNVFSRLSVSRDGSHQRSRPNAVPAPHFLSKRPPVVEARRPSEFDPASVAASAEDSLFLKQMEQLGRQLNELSHELQTSAQRSSDRELHYAEVTELLMKTQGKLTSQLETLVSQVSATTQQSAPAKPRAIA